MRCKKCKKQIPDKSNFCNWCGTAVVKKPHRRADGNYEKSICINGRRKTFYAKTERELTRKIAMYSAEQERSKRFDELAEDYKDNYLPELSPTTQKSYNTILDKFTDEFKGRAVNEIKPSDIQKSIDNLSRTYTAKTKRNYLAALSSVFSFAVRASEYGIDTNPCNYIKIKGKPSTERRIATDEEIKIICRNTKVHFGLFAFFLLTTGCRRSEALALKYEDIDFKNDVIHITKSVTWEKSIPELKAPKTVKGIRDIFLVPHLKDVLPKRKRGLIFPSSKGQLMTECQYAIEWHKYCAESGLDDYANENNLSPLTAHCLRHNYATILNEAGIDTKQAMQLLGHANEATTKDVYTAITERKNKSDKVLVTEKFEKRIQEITAADNP